ncbi:MAG: response regulator transcription factor [Chloroflexota bacterium]
MLKVNDLKLSPDSAFQRILIVDGLPETLGVLCHTLNKAGYEVWCAGSSQKALNLIERRGVPHLALIDVHLWYSDGGQLRQRLNAIQELPVIALAAADQEDVAIQALEQFAEDYLIKKPLRAAELVARVQRILRRVHDYSYTLNSPLRLDDHFSIDFSGRQAIVEGQPVSLTPIETQLLHILVQNAGRYVSTGSLLNRLWPLESAGERRLHVHVSRLRRKIESHTAPTYTIMTKRDLGYTIWRDLPSPERLLSGALDGGRFQYV